MVQPQPLVQTRDSQPSHDARAENIITSNPLTLSTNDSTTATSIGMPSRDPPFNCREYGFEVDLVLSVALVGNKELQYSCDQAEATATTDNAEPAQVDSQSQNDGRYACTYCVCMYGYLQIWRASISGKQLIHNILEFYC